MEIDLFLVEINLNLWNDERFFLNEARRKIKNSIFWPEKYLCVIEIKI